jgi:putative ABC transport system permease protein
MEIGIILKSMRRNKVGAALIAVQMAVTLAILCNALVIIQQRLDASRRPSGTDEANIFVLKNQWIGDSTDLVARTETDLSTLRALPGVADAYSTNSYPLGNGGDGEDAARDPDDVEGSRLVAEYMGDEHVIPTLGLKLVAGRNFTPDEVADLTGYRQSAPPKAALISKALADKLFPNESPLGKLLYISYDHHGVPIVGVIDTLQVPWSRLGEWGSKFFYSTIVVPVRYAVPHSTYIVRAKPGQLADVMKAAQKKLIEIDRDRVLDGVTSLTEARAESYKDDHGLTVMLTAVSGALLLVTGFGIVGLTSYWVAQRRRQIGIRRALGATRQAIVRYFQTENFIIAASGTLLGVTLAIAVNVWMVTSFEMDRLDSIYAVIGAAAILLLGQLAVLYPALRAASVPPALATRGV